MKLLMALPALMLLSCGSPQILLQPEGSSAEVYLRDGKIQTAELLAFQDSVVLCATDSLLEIPLANVRSVRLKIDESRGWVLQVIFSQGPLVILGATLGNMQIGAIALGICALTWASFEISGPRVRFDKPWRQEDIEALRLHMRYPQRLTDDQIVNLRRSFASKKH